MDPSTPNITVTEAVYDTDGSRVFLAAAVGDQLSAADAKRLKVGANGKSSNGITPAETLHIAGPSGDDSEQSEAPPATLETFAGLNATDAKKAVAAFDVEALDAAEALEKARTGDLSPRTSVLGAIDKRRKALSEAE